MPSTTPMMSDSFMIRSSSPSILTSVPLHLPNRISVAGLDVQGDELAAFVAGARTSGDDFALLRLLLGGVRDDDAALRLFLAFDATDDDAVMQGTEFHECFLFEIARTGRGFASWHSILGSANGAQIGAMRAVVKGV